MNEGQNCKDRSCAALKGFIVVILLSILLPISSVIAFHPHSSDANAIELLRTALDSTEVEDRHREVFTRMIQSLSDSSVPVELDSIRYDHFFLEMYHNTDSRIHENKVFYFVEGDSIPRVMLLNGDSLNIKQHYQTYTGLQKSYLEEQGYLSSKLRWHEDAAALQTFRYPTRVYELHGSVDHPTKGQLRRTGRRAERQFSTTYCILFMYERGGRIKYSFQTPPKHPDVDAVPYNPTGDF